VSSAQMLIIPIPFLAVEVTCSAWLRPRDGIGTARSRLAVDLVQLIPTTWSVSPPSPGWPLLNKVRPLRSKPSLCVPEGTASESIISSTMIPCIIPP